VLLIALVVTACSVQRAEVASEAQSKMVGMSNQQVLECMGAPERRATVGDTEVWSYVSGGDTSTFGHGTASMNATGQTNVFGSSHSVHRYCVVNIVMTGGRVAAVHYTGRTGGVLTRGEQCAFAVQNCLQ
jgi:hypothetical protein